MKQSKKQKMKILKIVAYVYTSITILMLILGIIDQSLMFTGASGFIGAFSCFTFIALMLITIGVIATLAMLIKARMGCDDVEELVCKNDNEKLIQETPEKLTQQGKTIKKEIENTKKKQKRSK